jgi:hypothetical protein
MSSKSPFYVVDELVSPLQCEDIICRLAHTVPDSDVNDVPLKTLRYNEHTESGLLPYLDDLVPTWEQYYGFELEGILPFQIEWYVEGFQIEPHRCGSFVYMDKRWVRTSDVGFTAIIFLNDYNVTPPFDPDFEVCGGRLEFLNHKFSFNPRRGTLVFFPAAPNFMHTTGPIQAGELNQIRVSFVPKTPYNYDMTKFPGNYLEWFKNR